MEMCIRDSTGTSHIEYTHFATGQKIRSFQRLDGFELQYFTYGPGSPYHHTVVHLSLIHI